MADDVFVLAEVGTVYVEGVDDGEFFRGARPGDQFAWGYKSRLTLTYFDALGELWDVLSGTDVAVKFNFSHDVDGVSAIPVGSFTDNQKAFGIGLDATWQNTITASLGYNNFFGADNDNALVDRDNVTFNLKYRF